jgi:amino acid transporter
MKRPRGLGLYTWRQVKYSTAFSLTATIIVGAVVALLGVGGAVQQISEYRAEQQQFGQASLNVGPCLAAAGFIAVGVFFAHAGVIYWCRRLFRRKRHPGRRTRP